MKRLLCYLAIVPILTGCGVTRIVTVSPDYGNRMSYSTMVTVPQTHVTTTTTRVFAADNDVSLYLDLQAVAAAFAQSSTIEQFETLLNDSSYMLSNLDLNNDGYVDYLRVLETVEGRAHVFVIQAVLGQNIYQDVATVVAEVSAASQACVQIIGSSYLYGPNYIIQPVYVVTPPVFAYLVRPVYKPWRSPWYWGHFPPHYKRPAPVYLSHYQAYVDTYMRNHAYCHEVRYATSCHYPDYVRVSRDVQRNDYGQMHPEKAFTERVANAPAPGAETAVSRSAQHTVNARNVREAQDAATVRTTGSSVSRSTGSGSSSNGVSRSAANSSSSGSVSRSAGSSSSSGSVSRSTGSNSSTSSASRSSGREAGSVSRSAGTSSTGAAKSSGTSASRSSQSSGSTVSRSSSSSSSASRGQTTVKSNVKSSGTSNTRISTVSPSGATSTVTRGSQQTQRSVGRSSSTGTSGTSRR